jgi:hypothetical protein
MATKAKRTVGCGASYRDREDVTLCSAPNDSTTDQKFQDVIFGQDNLIPCPHCTDDNELCFWCGGVGRLSEAACAIWLSEQQTAMMDGAL